MPLKNIIKHVSQLFFNFCETRRLKLCLQLTYFHNIPKKVIRRSMFTFALINCATFSTSCYQTRSQPFCDDTRWYIEIKIIERYNTPDRSFKHLFTHHLQAHETYDSFNVTNNKNHSFDLWTFHCYVQCR